MADIIEIPMTPAQYVAARQALSVAPGVAHVPLTTTTGTVKSSQLDFTYSYDGGSSITLSDLVRHGFWVEHASLATIQKHVMSQLLELKA